jgi:hypothetical protein
MIKSHFKELNLKWGDIPITGGEYYDTPVLRYFQPIKDI